MRLLEDFLDTVDTEEIVHADVTTAERDGQGKPSLKRHQYQVSVLVTTSSIYKMTLEEFIAYKTKTLSSVSMLMRQCPAISSYSAPVLVTDNGYALENFPDMFDELEIPSFGGIFVIVSFDAQFRNTKQIIQFFGTLYLTVMGRYEAEHEAHSIISVTDGRSEDGEHDEAICGNGYVLYGTMKDKNIVHYRTTFSRLLVIPEMFRPELRTYHDIMSITSVDNDHDMLEDAMRLCNGQSNRRPKKVALPKSLSDAISNAQITRIHAAGYGLSVTKNMMYHRASKEISIKTIELENPCDSKSPVVLHTIRALHERPMLLGDKWMMKTTSDGRNIHFLASLPIVVCTGFIYNTCICVSTVRNVNALVEFVRVLNGMTGHAFGDEQAVAEIIFNKSK